MGKTLGWIGFGCSSVYVGLLGWLVFGRLDSFHKLELNELGDFLAGAFGPLAILWLILGYFQQGIELRQNSQALHLQATELANSVEQQREMVKVAREQYESDRQALQLQIDNLEQERAKQRRLALPKFSITTGGSHSTESTHSVTLSNYGNTCTELRIQLANGDYPFSPEYFPLVSTGNGVTAHLVLPRTPPFQSNVLKLSFLDSAGLPSEITYEMTFRKDAGYSTPVFKLAE